MKKLCFLITLIFVLCFIGQGIVPAKIHAFMPREWCYQTDVKTIDAILHTGAGFFYGIAVFTDGAALVTIKLYDNTSASGTRLLPDWEVTSSSVDRAQTFSIDPPIPFSIGVFCDITTSGTVSYMGFYRER